MAYQGRHNSPPNPRMGQSRRRNPSRKSSNSRYDPRHLRQRQESSNFARQPSNWPAVTLKGQDFRQSPPAASHQDPNVPGSSKVQGNPTTSPLGHFGDIKSQSGRPEGDWVTQRTEDGRHEAGEKVAGVSGRSDGELDSMNEGVSDNKGDKNAMQMERRDLLQEELANIGVDMQDVRHGTFRMVCPKCEGGSTGEASFSVTVSQELSHAMFNCFRAKCGFSGAVWPGGKPAKPAKPASPFPKPMQRSESSKRSPPNLLPLNEECLAFFSQRGISEKTLERNKVGMVFKGTVAHIAFPYFKEGEIVNVKYRTLDKKFSQEKGGEQILYGLDDVKDCKEVIVVEGELDKLALEEAGFLNVASVPSGAPASVREEGVPELEQDKKFAFVWNCREVFEDAEKVVLATDNDDPGMALAEELARRVGIFKCWKVEWPTSKQNSLVEYENEEEMDDKDFFRKDANDVLMEEGPEALAQYIDMAAEYPVAGLMTFVDFAEEIMEYFLMRDETQLGKSTGWPGLDAYYKVVPGELTIVTGVPNSGKSEWLDALAVNLAMNYGWAIAFCSMEKQIRDHARQLIEKFQGRPFFSGTAYARGVDRMTEDEVRDGILWAGHHFPLIRCETDELPSVDWVLETARVAVLRYGIRGLVIDPYNELDHQRPRTMSETEYVSQMLTKVKRFAQTYRVHVWFVAHPRQMYQWKGEAPNLYDISGSSHFINKADAGVVVHRNWEKHSQNSKEDEDAEQSASDDPYEDEDDSQFLVRILIRKMRNKAAGTVGEHTLKYDPVNGRYSDPRTNPPPPPPPEPAEGQPLLKIEESLSNLQF